MQLKRMALFLAGVLIAAGSSPAKTRATPAEPCVQVVGHLSLEGLQANRLFVRQSAHGKRYLYAVPTEGRAVMVVNVSVPNHPVLEGQVSYEDRGETRGVTPVGLNAAIIEIADHPATGRLETPARRNIGVMDLSDPGNPKIACRFADVSGYLVDESKSLIYIVNGEGLWIVRHHEPPDVSVEAWEKFAAAP
jgi:hypothetical protein